jgi:hypothetical protein
VVLESLLRDAEAMRAALRQQQCRQQQPQPQKPASSSSARSPSSPPSSPPALHPLAAPSSMAAVAGVGSPLQLMVALLEARRESLKDENEALGVHNRALRSYLGGSGLALPGSPLDAGAECGGGMAVAAALHGVAGGVCHGCGGFSTPGSRAHSQPGTRPATPCQIGATSMTASMATLPQQPPLTQQQQQQQQQQQAAMQPPQQPQLVAQQQAQQQVA